MCNHHTRYLFNAGRQAHLKKIMPDNETCPRRVLILALALVLGYVLQQFRPHFTHHKINHARKEFIHGDHHRRISRSYF